MVETMTASLIRVSEGGSRGLRAVAENTSAILSYSKLARLLLKTSVQSVHRIVHSASTYACIHVREKLPGKTKRLSILCQKIFVGNDFIGPQRLSSQSVFFQSRCTVHGLG